MKKCLQKLLIIGPNFFQYCQPAQNQPKSQILFHENGSQRDLCFWYIMTLLSTYTDAMKKNASWVSNLEMIIVLGCFLITFTWQLLTHKSPQMPSWQGQCLCVYFIHTILWKHFWNFWSHCIISLLSLSITKALFLEQIFWVCFDFEAL